MLSVLRDRRLAAWNEACALLDGSAIHGRPLARLAVLYAELDRLDARIANITRGLPATVSRACGYCRTDRGTGERCRTCGAPAVAA